MIVYTSPSVPPLEGKGWLRTENVLPIFNGLLNVPADKKIKPCLGFSLRQPIKDHRVSRDTKTH